MIVKDARGNELLEIIQVSEEEAEKLYTPITHCLLVVRIGNDYLLGWNKWRQNWETFGGCREEGETLRECIARECLEEIGIENPKFEYLGLMCSRRVPDYFSPETRIEYGGLYGISLPETYLEVIERCRQDREEIERIALYGKLESKEDVVKFDEALLKFYTGGNRNEF